MGELGTPFVCTVDANGSPAFTLMPDPPKCDDRNFAPAGDPPTIDPKTLRPVAHWEEIPGSYEICAGKNGSWHVPATRCSNPECGEVNPCGLKTPFCPMCGFRMEDVPYDT